MTTNAGASFSGRTAGARNIAAPIRNYLSTESGSAMVLLAATVAAMLWANSPWGDSYESVWETTLQVQLGGDGISLDLRHWIN
jgi:Na+/H+ antiporter NhaA